MFNSKEKENVKNAISNASSTIVKIEEARKEYLLGKTVVPALKGVDLEVNRGEFLAISGPSGSGKTTLLNLVGCIEKPTSGKVWIGNVEVGKRTSDELAELRSNQIGYIFQTFNLLPVLSAFENVEYPLLERNLTSKERKVRVDEALASVGLSSYAHHKPLELSGGQRQRVAIARAIVVNPVLILADEPTANLDQKTGTEILNLMKAINQNQGTTFVFSTHDPKVVERATRVVKLSDGTIIH